jgi:hypothetical protein
MPNPPVVLTCVSGRTVTFARQTPNADNSYGGVYTGSEPITFTVWPEDSEVAVLTQTGSPNGWINASETIWAVTLVDSQTASLAPGIYQFQVTSPPSGTSGETGTLFAGLLEVTSSAGSVVPNNLASSIYVGKALTQINLAPGEWEYLPDCIGAASDLIRKGCNRLFYQSVFTETVPVALNGYVRLSQIPVNTVLRVQCSPAEALTVGNSTAATAWISAAITGDASGFTGGPTVTGLILNAESNGSVTSTTITFSSLINQEISTLAAAINGVGNGWSASAGTGYGGWSIAELYDAIDGKGASPSDLPDGGAIYHVFGSNVANIPHPDDGAKTGMIYVGRINDGGQWARWGPGGMFDDEYTNANSGRVKVTYNGGYASIPLPVQMATAELVKGNFERLKTEAYLKSENADKYSYTLAEELIGNLPKAVRQTLSEYRVSNA